ncbi:MAG: S8 family serine peptidase [Ignisphaera sp.]
MSKTLSLILLSVVLIAAVNGLAIGIAKAGSLSNASEYIIYFKDRSELSQISLQCMVESIFWNIGAALALCNQGSAEALRNMGFAVYPNSNVSIHSTLSSLRIVGDVKRVYQEQTGFGNISSAWSWAISRVGADIAWRFFNALGYNVTIAILDTGIDPTHPLIAGKLVGWIEFDRKGKPVCSDPHDTYGHGTWVASIAAGGDGERYVFGVAPEARIISALVLPAGSGTDAQVLAGLDWVLKPYDCMGRPLDVGRVNVVSMSFGAPGNYSNVFLPAIEKLIENGIVAVAAIGNEGPYTSSNPGNIWGVIGVGATDFNDETTWFSSYEYVEWPDPPATWPFEGEYPKTYEKPDVVAPGTDVPGAFPGGLIAIGSGTSASTPIVAGIAGIVSSILYSKGLRGPQLVMQVYNILTSSTDPVSSPGAGKGLVNMFKAVAKALEYQIYSLKIGVYPYETPISPLSRVAARISGLYEETQLSIYVAGAEVYRGVYTPGSIIEFVVPPTHVEGNEVIVAGIEESHVYYGKTLIYINPAIYLPIKNASRIANISSGAVLDIGVGGVGIGDLIAIYIGDSIAGLDTAGLRGWMHANLIVPYVERGDWYNITVYDYSNPSIVLSHPLYISKPVMAKEVEVINRTYIVNNTIVNEHRLYTLLPLLVNTKSYYVAGEEGYIEISSPINISVDRVEIVAKPSNAIDVRILNISKPYANVYRVWIEPIPKTAFTSAEAIATIYIRVNGTEVRYITTLSILSQKPEEEMAKMVGSMVDAVTRNMTIIETSLENRLNSIAAEIESIRGVESKVEGAINNISALNQTIHSYYKDMSGKVDTISKGLMASIALAVTAIALAVIAIVRRGR